MTLSSRMIVVLTCVGFLSGGILTGVGLITQEKIIFNKQQEIEEAIVKVLPGTINSEKLYEEKDFTIYGGKTETGDFLGFAVYGSGTGFQDRITLMFGINTSLTEITRLTVLEHLETPGLGAKITDNDTFLRFWENKDTTGPLTLRKPAASSPEKLSPSEVNTITGATISSEAVLNIVSLSLEKLRSLQNEGKLLSEDRDVH